MSTASIGFGDTGGGGSPWPRILVEDVAGAVEIGHRAKFSPEFRNRLDAIVTFRPLSQSTMETIVEKFILQLESQLAERRVAFALEPDARAWLARKGYNPVYGARPLARVVQQEVRNRLTDEILFGRLEHGGQVRIGLAEDRLTFAFE